MVPRPTDRSHSRGCGVGLRLSSVTGAAHSNPTHAAPTAPNDMEEDANSDDEPSDVAAPIRWARLARQLEERDLPVSGVVNAIFDTYGMPALIGLVSQLDHPGAYCLALAEGVSTGSLPESQGSALLLASAAAGRGPPSGHEPHLIPLGRLGDPLPVT